MLTRELTDDLSGNLSPAVHEVLLAAISRPIDGTERSLQSIAGGGPLRLKPSRSKPVDRCHHWLPAADQRLSVRVPGGTPNREARVLPWLDERHRRRGGFQHLGKVPDQRRGPGHHVQRVQSLIAG